MDESFGAQYALQIALQTLRERCQQFQQRISFLEEENVNLRSKADLNRDFSGNCLPEIDALKQQVNKLTEEKLQLTSNTQMISAENCRLWSRLSKLTQANENLGSKLTRINDTLSQHNTNAMQQIPHAGLIRSKTFTQDQPHLKFMQKVTDENDKISLELEDISLKLISTIAREKSELELQCSQMTEIQNSDAGFINSFAFAYPTCDVEDQVLGEFDGQLSDLKNIKQALLQQKEKLHKNINNLKLVSVESNCTTKKEGKTETVCVSVQTITEKEKSDLEDLEGLANWGTPENSNIYSAKTSSNTSKANEEEKICPMCSKIYHSNCKFSDFQNHVESHFLTDGDAQNAFEVIS